MIRKRIPSINDMIIKKVTVSFSIQFRVYIITFLYNKHKNAVAINDRLI